jgi:hypothetical protein
VDQVSKAKAKGTDAEVAVVKFLNENGFPFAERRVTAGANDKGDINISPDVVIEVKNQATMALSTWVDEAITEQENADAWLAAVWHKRLRKGDAANWYVTMDGAQFLAILNELKKNGLIR